MKQGLKYFAVSLAAAGSVGSIVPVPGAFGDRIIVKESDGTFYIRVDDSEEIPLELGLKRIIHFEDSIRQLFLINKSAAAISVGIYVGWDEIVDARLNTFINRQVIVQARAATTTTTGTGIASLAAGANVNSAVLFAGTLKQVIVRNLSATPGEYLYLRNVSNVVVGVIAPGENFTYELIGEVVNLYNPNVGAVSYCLGCTYYA